MPSYMCVLWIPPEYLEEVDRLLGDVRWARQNEDRARGVVELTGDFPDDDSAVAEAARVTPDRFTGDADIRYLTASESVIQLVGQELGRHNDTSKMTGIVARHPAGPDGSVTDEPPAPQPPASQPPASQAEDDAAAKPPPPKIGETAEIIREGLRAITAPPGLWAGLSHSKRGELAEGAITGIYAERALYARNVRWLLAPEAELMAAATEGGEGGELATKVLESRMGLAGHQIELAREETNLLKTRVTQQQQITLLMAEFVEQLKKWRSLAGTARNILWTLVIFSMVATAALITLVVTDDFDVWALPVTIFVLALFTISPVVLLLLERPLKGIDEFAPGEKPDPDPDPDDSGTGADGATPKVGKQAGSTQAYGETSQPKAYGPKGSSRT